MIVTRDNFKGVVARLSQAGEYGLDTETTGLQWHDRVFSIILADEKEEFYFNFNRKDDIPADCILPREWIAEMQSIFDNEGSYFFIHNAKFDLHKLAADGICVLGEVHCTENGERLLYNVHLDYRLDTCAKRRGLAKDDAVKAYIKKNKLVTHVDIEGKGKELEILHFDRVPWDLMVKYATHDARLHYIIGKDQRQKLKEKDHAAPAGTPTLQDLLSQDRKLTKALLRVEDAGMRIDRDFTREALHHTNRLARDAMVKFQDETGLPFEDKASVIKKAFQGAGIQLPLTPSGQPCTNKDVLDELDNPIADRIREIRSHMKMCSTYYSSFLHFADHDGLIHANIRQGGTGTGRFSYGDPNLQNVPKQDDKEFEHERYLVRRCFVPTGEDWCLVPIDFCQQEFCLTADYAGERSVIDAINAGADFHVVVAELMGVPRKAAKTLNFGLLYGMGVAKLARSLSKALGRLVSLDEARQLRAEYFSRFPGIHRFMRGVMETAEKRGYVRNWNGFRCHLADPAFAYAIPNHLIQGSGAQVTRIAMVRIDEYIRAHRLQSRMVAQVHDELVFMTHRSELQHVPEFQRIMEAVYIPRNGLKLRCSVEHSYKSWAKWDLTKGAPGA